MKKSRYDALVASLTGIARKVFQAVPAQERWQVKAICAELHRTGHNVEQRVVEGCLDSLVDSGLVREGPGGYFIRVLPKEVDQSATVEDDVVEEAVVTAEPPPPDTTVVQLFADEPFRVVPNDNEAPVRNHRYEHYLSIRYERMQKALTVLAEHVDEEMGLALLEIVDEMDDLHEQVMEYRHDLDCPPDRKMVLNPGWYHHVVGDLDFFTKSETPPTADEVIAEKDSRRKMMALSAEAHEISPALKAMHAEHKKYDDELFREFEPNGLEQPCYDSLLDKLKNHVPDLNTDTSEVHLEQVRAKIRRGMCDVKIEGVSQSHEYRAWQNLVTPTAVEARREQGLEMEDAWKDSFKAFLTDVGYKPHHNARFVRIDKTKGWFKDNVIWRLNGIAVEGRQRRPRNWPFNYDRVGLVRSLERSVKSVTNELLKK